MLLSLIFVLRMKELGYTGYKTSGCKEEDTRQQNSEQEADADPQATLHETELAQPVTHGDDPDCKTTADASSGCKCCLVRACTCVCCCCLICALVRRCVL